VDGFGLRALDAGVTLGRMITRRRTRPLASETQARHWWRRRAHWCAPDRQSRAGSGSASHPPDSRPGPAEDGCSGSSLGPRAPRRSAVLPAHRRFAGRARQLMGVVGRLWGPAARVVRGCCHHTSPPPPPSFRTVTL
jgi:hypothetical protein